MQFVLNDQRRRIELPAIFEQPAPARLGSAEETDTRLEPIDIAEECTGFTLPREARKLVNGRNEEGRQPAIDRLVYGQDWQGSLTRKIAPGVDAADFHIGWRRVVRHTRE